MANLFYDPINGGVDLQVYKDPQVLPRADLESERDTLNAILGLDDALRTTIASNGLASIGLPSFVGQPDPLASFDAWVDDRLNVVLDVLDYFDYDSGDAGLVVRQPTWFTPIAVADPQPDDNGVDVAANMIDKTGPGEDDLDHGTWWQSETPGTREVILEVRAHRKKFDGIRVRVPNTDQRAQLQNVTIKAAAVTATLDNPSNEVASGVNFTYVDNIWVEYMFPRSVFGRRYVKLEIPESRHSTPAEVRIRSVQVLAGIWNHD